VAIKLHVGEFGNPYYIQPLFLHDIVRKVKEAGANLSHGLQHILSRKPQQRLRSHNERADERVPHGSFHRGRWFTQRKFSESENKGDFEEIEVSGAIAEADAMIVVTMTRDMNWSGFGGAIKNLGMGCTSRAGKLRQHRNRGAGDR